MESKSRAKVFTLKADQQIVNIPLGHPTGTGKWQLYDLSTDQGETADLALQHPDKLQSLVALWKQYSEETGAVFGPPIQGPPRPLLPDQIGGDPVEDQKAWMRVGVNMRLPVA